MLPETEILLRQKHDETLVTLNVSGKNFMAIPLYGKSFLICSCYRKLGVKEKSKLMKGNIKKHLKDYSCFAYSEIADEVVSFLDNFREKKSRSANKVSTEEMVPLSLETIFTRPDHIKETDGQLCVRCHKLKSNTNRNKCCETPLIVKTKMYVNQDTKNATYLLKSIVDKSDIVIKYLKQAYGMEDFEEQLARFREENLSYSTKTMELKNEISSLKQRLIELQGSTSLARGGYIGPDVEEIRKYLKEGEDYFNLPSNESSLVDGNIPRMLNISSSITESELCDLHRLPREASCFEEKELRKLAFSMMKAFNSKIDNLKGVITVRIAQLGRNKESLGFRVVGTTTIEKYSQACVAPLFVYLYRTDELFQSSVKQWISEQTNELEIIQDNYFPQFFKIVLMNVIRFLQSPSPFNPLLKFLQAMSVNLKVNVTEPRKSRRINTRHVKQSEIEKDNEEDISDDDDKDDSDDDDEDDDSDDDDDDDDDDDKNDLDHNDKGLITDYEVSFCSPVTLNSILHALKYFCYGCVLMNWNQEVPIDSYLEGFSNGIIFSQISNLLEQLRNHDKMEEEEDTPKREQVKKRTRTQSVDLDLKRQLQEQLKEFKLHNEKQFEEIRRQFQTKLDQEESKTKNQVSGLKQKLAQAENSLELSLSCQICEERRKDTVLSSCGHTFCSICVADVMKKREKNCPQCRQVIQGSVRMFF